MGWVDTDEGVKRPRQADRARVTDQSRKYWQSGNEHPLSVIKAAGRAVEPGKHCN